MSLLRFAVNTSGRDKDWDFSILSSQFQDQDGTLETVRKHVKAGHALCAGLLKGKWREKSNFAGSYWVLSEIDNSALLRDADGKVVKGEDGKGIKIYEHQMTLDEALAHPFIQQHCALIYTTPSHTPDWHRFRLVWLLPEFIQDISIYEATIRLLLEQLPHDPACKDGVRVFYGNTQAEFPLINPAAYLPLDWKDQAIALAEQERQEQEERLRLLIAKREAFRQLATQEGWNPNDLIKQALGYIAARTPRSGNYDQCIRVLMALVDYYGPIEGAAIAEGWSPSIPGTTWNIAQKVRSFRRKGITIGTLFKIAQEYGFKFPERKKTEWRDPREPDPEEYQAYQHKEAEQEQIEQTQANEAKINGIIDFLKKQQKKVPGWGFAPLSTADNSDVVQVKSHLEGHYFANLAGARLIVNVSKTGAQKSTFYSKTTPEFFGTERVIAVLPDSLNPSVPEFERWIHLEGRHLGNIRDLNGKLRRAKPDTPDSLKVTPANCDKRPAIEEINERNTVNPGSMLACFNCQHHWQCGQELGNGYGSRYQASLALKQPRVRTSYGRLHGQGEEADLLSTAALVLDESSSNISQTKAIKVSLRDIKDKLLQILQSGEPSLQQLIPLLTYLTTQEWKAINRHYGVNKAKVIPLLKPYLPEQIDWETLKRLESEDEELQAFGLKSDVKLLSGSEKRRLKKLQSLKWLAPDQQQEFYQLESLTKRSKAQNKRLQTYRTYALTPELERERDELQKRQNASKREYLSPAEMRAKATFLNKRWLRDFLLVITSATYGHVHWGGEGVTITLPDSQHLAAIQCAQKVILSDASELRSKAELSKKYGIPEEEIFIFEVKQPQGADMETVLVTGLGKLGRNRGEGLEKCRQALITRFKEIDPTHATFDGKYFESDGVLFRDNVGSNDYKHCKSISTTLPRPSINALLAEYCVLNETTVDETDKGFQRFYQEHVAQALKQTRGRLREQLRPGEKLTFYILADENIPIAGDRIVEAVDLCPEAARKGKRAVRSLVEVAKWVLDQGGKLTQSAVARASAVLGLNKGTGYCQQRISKLWGEILENLQLFLEIESNKSSSPAPGADTKVDALVPVIEEIAHNVSPEGLDEVMAWLSRDEWAIAFNLLSDLAKKKLVQCWASMLPVGWLEAIDTLFPGRPAAEVVVEAPIVKPPVGSGLQTFGEDIVEVDPPGDLDQEFANQRVPEEECLASTDLLVDTVLTALETLPSGLMQDQQQSSPLNGSEQGSLLSLPQPGVPVSNSSVEVDSRWFNRNL